MTALGSIAASSPECERALGLLAHQQDAQRSVTGEADWLRTHMDSCDTCPLSREAMQEAGASYRALGPIVALEWLRHATIARAARFVGADWSHIAGPAGVHGPADVHGSATVHGAAGVRGATLSSTSAPFGGWVRVARKRLHPTSVPGRTGERRRRWLLAGVLGVCLLAILAVVLVGGVTPDSRVVPRRLTLDPGAITSAHAGGRRPAHLFRTVHRGDVAANPANTSQTRGQAGALAAVAHVPGAQAVIPTPAVQAHHERRVTHHKATHRSHASLPAPASGTPAPQPAGTTPTSTTPAPSPPSSGSGGSTGSGSSTSTGGGETPPHAETPAGPPGGEPPKTTPSCTLAIAC